jgi:hypothetical protein
MLRNPDKRFQQYNFSLVEILDASGQSIFHVFILAHICFLEFSQCEVTLVQSSQGATCAFRSESRTIFGTLPAFAYIIARFHGCVLIEA